MAIHSDAYYKRLAEDRLQEAGVLEPPVPLERVSEALGIPVRLAALPTFFIGALLNEDGLPTILLNSAIGDRERRRAFGHTIGHMLMVLADDGGSYPRDVSEHHEADLVSRELIMPDYLVVDQARKWFNDHRYLARLFGVTEKDMLEKMTELGLVRDRGIRWDY